MVDIVLAYLKTRTSSCYMLMTIMIINFCYYFALQNRGVCNYILFYGYNVKGAFVWVGCVGIFELSGNYCFSW